MKKIEELMGLTYNLERFRCLKSELEQGRLVVFFGAGLSLSEKSTRWGYPFEWVYEKLQDAFCKIKDAIEMQLNEQGKGPLQNILDHPQTSKEEEIGKIISAIQQGLKDAQNHINERE